MNNFPAALFAFFFWSRTTASQEDSTRHSSWMRTYTFFILTISVGLLYLKTLEVPMLTNYVDVRAETYTAKDDTIGEHVKLCFNNAMDDEDLNSMSDSGLLQSLYFESGNHVYQEKKSGLTFGLYTIKDTAYKVRKRYYFFNPVNSKVRTSAKGPDTIVYKVANKRIADGFYHTYNSDSLRNLLNNYDIRYVIVTKSRNVHMMMPVIIYSYLRDHDNIINEKYSEVSTHHFYPQSKALSGWFNNINVDSLLHGNGFIGFMGLSIDREKSDNNNTYQTLSSLSNHFGFFTAADISQSNYQLLVHSDCPIDEIKVVFNTPVEMQQLPFKVDEISPYGFTINTPELIEKVTDRDVRFFVKFPAMANKQLVRSLILTTLLTALASLFLTNLYFCIRRLYRKQEEESQLSKRLKRAKRCHNALVFIILAIVLLYAISVYNDWIIYLPNSFLTWRWGIVVAFILFFFGIEYALYRYARSRESI